MRKLVIAGALLLAPAASFAGIFLSVGIAPPPLPVYTQPLCPGDGYLWTPGFWHYGPGGYYWVPGVWVRPPQAGFLWTPAYWGWGGSAFIFHEGYWGPHVGFYGGVNYGFGYGGRGYEGGYWNHGAFEYNRSVNNINVGVIHNVYNRNIVVNNANRVSYNGGNGGISARASAQEQAAIRERHVAVTGEQQTHFQAARNDRSQLASVNGGRPQTAALPRVGERPGNQQQARVTNNVRSGPATAQEHQQVNQRQNNVSRPAANDNHNAAAVQQRQQAAAAPQRQQAAPQRQQAAPQHQQAAAPQHQQAAPQQHQQAAPQHQQAAPQGGHAEGHPEGHEHH